jgi:hypothetical protein
MSFFVPSSRIQYFVSGRDDLELDRRQKCHGLRPTKFDLECCGANSKRANKAAGQGSLLPCVVLSGTLRSEVDLVLTTAMIYVAEVCSIYLTFAK